MEKEISTRQFPNFHGVAFALILRNKLAFDELVAVQIETN
jgi:hypothetical protein